MPGLVNYSGDYGFYFERSDDGRLCSLIGLLNDTYYPPRKRSRVSLDYAGKGDMYDNMKRPSIEVLPDECLFEIFKRLSGSRERSISAFVSKRWLGILSSIRNLSISLDNNVEEVCEGHLDRSLEGKKATDTRLAAIAVGIASRGGLGKLSIRGSNHVPGVTDFGLSAIGHGCPSLRELILCDITTIGDDGLVEIGRGCHLLEKLDLCECPSVSDKGLVAIAEKCPNLTTLAIDSCSSIGNKSLQAIGKYCPKLQSVSVKNCPLVGDEGIAVLMSSRSTTLQSIKLQLLNVSDLSLVLIGHYGLVITDLLLSGLQEVSERGFWIMAKGKGLQLLASLTLTSCKGATDLTMEVLSNGCPNLKQMCLRKCCFVSDGGLLAFAKAARSLEILQLEECNRISQTGLIGALANCSSKLKSLSFVNCLGIKDMPLECQTLSLPCQSLLSLSIRYCPGFTSTSLAIVGTLCPKLRHLDLSGLHEITDEALLPLLETCEAGLMKVNLSDCVNLTDVSILALARLHGKTLELLNLQGCKKVTDASLIAISYYCFLINDLDVSKCSITDFGVIALCSEVYANFQILSISGCSMVSDKSCPYLKMLGESLIALNIRNCNSLSCSKVDQLIEELWGCDIFS